MVEAMLTTTRPDARLLKVAKDIITDMLPGSMIKHHVFADYTSGVKI